MHPDLAPPATATRRTLLNVSGPGGGGALPAAYTTAFTALTHDSDVARRAGFDGDLRSLAHGNENTLDAIYCSHTLEHFPLHEVSGILAGMHRVLKPGGFAHLRVPDIPALMRKVAEEKLDLDSVLYHAGAGAITVRDLIWGHAPSVAREQRSSNMAVSSAGHAHRTGFSRRTLAAALYRAGFSITYSKERRLELSTLAFKGTPDAAACALFNLTHVPKGTLQ
jgi:SAM-dependent methyltransferase